MSSSESLKIIYLANAMIGAARQRKLEKGPLVVDEETDGETHEIVTERVCKTADCSVIKRLHILSTTLSVLAELPSSHFAALNMLKSITNGEYLNGNSSERIR